MKIENFTAQHVLFDLDLYGTVLFGNDWVRLMKSVIRGDIHSCLTLCQTKKIWTPNQTKSMCRQQIQCCQNADFFLRQGGKHCGKRRKCWLPAFSPFPTMFSKGSFHRINYQTQNYVGISSV